MSFLLPKEQLKMQDTLRTLIISIKSLVGLSRNMTGIDAKYINYQNRIRTEGILICHPVLIRYIQLTFKISNQTRFYKIDP